MHVSFDAMYSNNYYEVPNEYLVPKNVRNNELISKIFCYFTKTFYCCSVIQI